MIPRDEKITTAMLLQMEYSDWLDCYIKSEGDGKGHDTWIDAETGHTLTPDEKGARIIERINLTNIPPPQELTLPRR